LQGLFSERSAPRVHLPAILANQMKSEENSFYMVSLLIIFLDILQIESRLGIGLTKGYLFAIPR